MFDLIIKGGTLPDGRATDIGIKGDRIAAIEDLSTAEARSSVGDAVNQARSMKSYIVSAEPP